MNQIWKPELEGSQDGLFTSSAAEQILCNVIASPLCLGWKRCLSQNLISKRHPWLSFRAKRALPSFSGLVRSAPWSTGFFLTEDIPRQRVTPPGWFLLCKQPVSFSLLLSITRKFSFAFAALWHDCCRAKCQTARPHAHRGLAVTGSHFNAHPRWPPRKSQGLQIILSLSHPF